jgi:hypothetical protein
MSTASDGSLAGWDRGGCDSPPAAGDSRARCPRRPAGGSGARRSRRPPRRRRGGSRRTPPRTSRPPHGRADARSGGAGCDSATRGPAPAAGHRTSRRAPPSRGRPRRPPPRGRACRGAPRRPRRRTARPAGVRAQVAGGCRSAFSVSRSRAPASAAGRLVLGRRRRPRSARWWGGGAGRRDMRSGAGSP